MQIWDEKYDPIDESGLDLLIAHKSIDYRPGKYKWSKTKEFQESGLYFKKNGRYCDYIPGSPSFEDFWDAEEYKIKHGMINSDGHYICGRMYSYLNYGIIYDKKKKELVLPDFWDSDAYFWIEETKSELRGLKFGGTKARQRGYSLKGGHRVILQFYHVPNSISYVGSFIEDKAAKFWEMVEANARHLDAHTPWHKNKTPSTKDFWKAQVLITEDTGKKTFKGFMSEFHKVTFKQSPSSGVGGACHGINTKIVMSDGTLKNIQDIKIGDFVLGIDGKAKKVNHLFNGKKQLFNVIPNKGLPFTATNDHLLYLQNRDIKVKNDFFTLKVEDWNNLSDYKKINYVQHRNNKELKFENESNPTINPYYLGLWLGDGFRSSLKIIVNKTTDIEIYNYLLDLFGENNHKRKESDRYSDEMYIMGSSISKDGTDSEYLKEFVKYNLFYNKHIPKELYSASPEYKKQVLAGLIDSDGYYTNTHTYQISFKSLDFAKQVMLLANSIGIICNISKKQHKGHGIIKPTISYCLTMSISDNTIPTKLPRKTSNYKKQKNNFTSPIKEIIDLGEQEYYGINVDGHLYFLEDYTITHNCDLFIYEEPGLAPTLMQTIKYLEPAMSDGDYVTGMFWSLGSVGELKDCKDLEKIARSPKDYGFAQFPNDFDPKKSNPPCGWFHPASWSYKGFIDAEGNSDVEGATARILEKREKASRQSPKDYILAITQDPLTLDEAFQARDVNKFPVKLISKRLTELEETNFRTTYVDLVSDPKATRTNSITWQLSDDVPVYDFPVKEHSYKKGVIEILEHPDENAEFGTYVAGLDPYKFDESKYSDSIGSIYIYKRTTSLNGNYLDTPVAWYAGRPENLDIFYDNVEKLVKYYNATVLIENDVNDIIRHFLQKNLHKYLAKTPGWIKDVAENTSVNTEYGIRATVKNIEHFENSIIKYIQEEIGTSFSEDGKVVHTKYGVDRIYDVMLLKELLQYSKTGNYDRIRSFGITLAYANGMDRIVGDANNVKDYSEMFNGITRAKGHFTGSKRNMFNMHRR